MAIEHSPIKHPSFETDYLPTYSTSNRLMLLKPNLRLSILTLHFLVFNDFSFYLCTAHLNVL
jgi:hypothetical protein